MRTWGERVEVVRGEAPKLNSQLQQTTPVGTIGEGLLSRCIIIDVVRFAFTFLFGVVSIWSMRVKEEWSREKGVPGHADR